MKYLYACYGGSGSSHLFKRLKSRYKCSLRPGTFFVPNYMPPLTGPKDVNNQILSSNGYADMPTAKSALGFKSRSGGYELNMNKNIDENMVDYVNWLKAQPKRTAMFSRAPMLGFFARNKIDGVVFSIRHPVHQYVSLTKKERHSEFVKDYGGVNTEAAIDYWIEEWGRFARDAVDSNNRIVRYEFAERDSLKISRENNDPTVADIFKAWTPGRRNPSVLRPDLEQRLQDGVSDVYFKIYDNWAV